MLLTRVVVYLGEPEVDDLQGRVRTFIFKEEVLRLQISRMIEMLPVTYFILVAVEQSLQDLFEHSGCEFLSEATSLLDTIKELAPRAYFHDQVDIFVILESFEQLDDIGVVLRHKQLTNFLRISISILKRSLFLILALDITFTALTSPVSRCLALKTFP